MGFPNCSRRWSSQQSGWGTLLSNYPALEHVCSVLSRSWPEGTRTLCFPLCLSGSGQTRTFRERNRCILSSSHSRCHLQTLVSASLRSSRLQVGPICLQPLRSLMPHPATKIPLLGRRCDRIPSFLRGTRQPAFAYKCVPKLRKWPSGVLLSGPR